MTTAPADVTLVPRAVDAWYRMGLKIAQRPWIVVCFWACVLAVSLPASRHMHSVLYSGIGYPEGSAADRVDRYVKGHFDNTFVYSVLVVCSSSQHVWTDPAFESAVDRIERNLRSVPRVRATRSFRNVKPWGLSSMDGHTTVVLVGLRAANRQEAESLIPLLRQVLARVRPEILEGDPDVQLLVTSDTAIDFDLHRLSAEDTSRSERIAFPLTLVLLLFAFGALVAAGLPIAIGLLSTTIASALIFLVAQVMPLSVYIETIAGMVGLGTSIDYALVMICRFREECGRLPTEEAVAVTVSTSGRAVATSGAMLVIANLSLFICDLKDVHSIALGCILVVIVAVVLTLTLLPALLALIGPGVNAPEWLTHRLRQASIGPERWERWARTVVDHPVHALVCGLLILFPLAAPILSMRTGVPDARWIPAAAESRQGFEQVASMGHSGLLTPIQILVQGQSGQSMLTPQNLTSLYRLVQSLERDPRVRSVRSLVSLEASMGLDEYIANYQDPTILKEGAWSEVLGALLSRERDATVVSIEPAAGLSRDAVLDLVRSIRSRRPSENLTLTVGGYAGGVLDYQEALRHASLPIVTCVVILTWLSLFVVLRSWLLPFKAILMNVLSVGASFGVLVAIFQWGWLARWIRLEDPPGYILASGPLILFCVVFGLSMDYEIFLVNRIQEYWYQTGDNRVATVRGLAATGGMITSAGMIMVTVFGTFALADLVILKMIALGLAVAVAVDVTVIRIAVAPAVMRLAGKYNWLPGPSRSKDHPAEQE